VKSSSARYQQNIARINSKVQVVVLQPISVPSGTACSSLFSLREYHLGARLVKHFGSKLSRRAIAQATLQ
jgi:hypothetical protein